MKQIIVKINQTDFEGPEVLFSTKSDQKLSFIS